MSKSEPKQENKEKKPYEKPEIIYEGMITTRSGSIIPCDDPFIIGDSNPSRGC